MAGSYEVGGMLTIYVNGEKVGERAASAVPVNPNTNPFRIGIAPWDVNALGLVGFMGIDSGEAYAAIMPGVWAAIAGGTATWDLSGEVKKGSEIGSTTESFDLTYTPS